MTKPSRFLRSMFLFHVIGPAGCTVDFLIAGVLGEWRAAVVFGAPAAIASLGIARHNGRTTKRADRHVASRSTD